MRGAGARADGREGFKVEGMFLVFQTPGRYAEFRKTFCYEGFIRDGSTDELYLYHTRASMARGINAVTRAKTKPTHEGGEQHVAKTQQRTGTSAH